MFRGFLWFVKVFNALPIRMCSNRPLFSLERKGRRPRLPVRLELEDLEGRLLLSTSPVGQPPVSTPLVAVMDRVDQMIVVVQNEVSSVVRTITQEIVQELAYLEMQLDHIFGIDAASQNTPLNSSMQSSGNGSGNIVAMASNASNQVSNIGALQADNGSGSSNATIKPQVAPDGPDAGGVSGFLWDPTNGNNASVAMNWDYNMAKQNPLIAKVPGQIPGSVTFDPQLTQTQGLSGNGAQPITWDYDAKFPSMNVGAESAYKGLQTINPDVAVELTGSGGTSLDMIVPTSQLNLDFADDTSVFLIDNNATITNMSCIGFGVLEIEGGITTIAQSTGYQESSGVQIDVGPNATLDDMGYCTLSLSKSDVELDIEGTMLVYYGTPFSETLISHFAGTTGNCISVNGGSLEYAGNGPVTDTFTVPVLVQGGGEFDLTSGPNPGGKLIVQGTVPNQANNASVYLTGKGSSIQMSQGVTLEADNDYFQDSGILETWDNSTSTLQDGAAGNGTAKITGGTVWIDALANSYGRLNLIGSLNFAGALVVSVQGYAFNGSEGASRDQLYVAANLTLNAPSTLQVYTYGTLVQKDYWNVITLPNNGVNIGGNFGSESSVPAGANMTYGPPNVPTVGKYRVTFNG